MSLSEELGRLGTLHERGVLSDDEFQRAKARVLAGTAVAGGPAVQALNALRRHRHDRWLGGVCGGIARATGVESWIWRVAFLLMVLLAGTGALVYLLLWVLMPADPATHALPGQAPAG